MTKWYCLNYDGNMEYVGEFDSFEAADDSLEYACVWLVDESDARDWLETLRELLED
jgi:hypothetical protein